jgi:SnoaL-like domain
MIDPASADEADLLDAVLTRWKAAVDARRPEQVAALFTADAIFQGLHPYAVGPAGVAEYYADSLRDAVSGSLACSTPSRSSPSRSSPRVTAEMSPLKSGRTGRHRIAPPPGR